MKFDGARNTTEEPLFRSIGSCNEEASELLTGVGGEGRGALGEEDSELAGSVLEEADQHGGSPRLKQLGGAGGRRYGGITRVRGGRRLVEPQPLNKLLNVRARIPLHGIESSEE
jgi:hypothetical protein